MNRQDKEYKTQRDLDDHSKGVGKELSIRAFHGTTHDFAVFDSSKKGNLEGAFGVMSYFSSSFNDAKDNYTEGNPELAARIEREYVRRGAVTQKDKETIKTELLGGNPQVLEVELSIKKPYHLDGKSPLFDGGFEVTSEGDVVAKSGEIIKDDPLLFPDLGRKITWVRDEVAQNYGYNDEEEMQDSFSDDYDDALFEMDDEEDRVVSARRDRVSGAIEKAVMDGGFGDFEEVEKSVWTKLSHLHLVGQNSFYHALRSAGSEFKQVNDLPGDAVFASQVIKNLGFDSIIMHDAGDRWPQFGMEPGTKHIHIFGEHESAIKILDRHQVFEKDRKIEKNHGTIVQEKMMKMAKEGKSLRESGEFSRENFETFFKENGQGRPALRPFDNLPIEHKAELAGVRLFAIDNHQTLEKGDAVFEGVARHWQKTRPGVEMPGLGVMDEKTYNRLDNDLVAYGRTMDAREFYEASKVSLTGRWTQRGVEFASQEHADEIARSGDGVKALRAKADMLRDGVDKRNMKMRAALDVFAQESAIQTPKSWMTLARTTEAIKGASIATGKVEAMALAFGIDKAQKAMPVREYVKIGSLFDER